MLLRRGEKRRACGSWGCRSSGVPGLRPAGASAVAARLGRSLIKLRRLSRISLAQPRAAISAQRDVILSLNIDIALLIKELKCLVYAQAF